MKRRSPVINAILVTILVAASCAKISAPTGGPRDRTPPVVVESSPANGARNFTGKEIEITFDEFVVLDNINEKFMVSPPMKRKPRVFTRGKSIRVQYEDELRDSTTYTFYFLDGIKDLNEGNILDNYRFAFSTGPVIDSLSVTGNAWTAVNLEIPEKTSVLLYRNPDDSAVVKQLPDYISRVDATGYFRFDNIRPGSYRLYALADDDNSKNYNRVEEAFGFLDSIITVTPEKNYIPPPPPDTTKTVTQKKLPAQTNGAQAAARPAAPILTGDYKLIVFNAVRKARYLAGSSRGPHYKLSYFLSVPRDTMDFSFSIPGSESSSYIIEESPRRDTITVWLTDSLLYSKTDLRPIIRYPFTDTLGVDGYKQDTLSQRFTFPKPNKFTKRAAPKKLSLRNNITAGTLKPGSRIIFTAETPLRDPDTSRIKLYEVVEKTRTPLSFGLVRDTLRSDRFIMNAVLPGGKQYLLITDSAAFSNIYNEVSDSLGINFSIREPSTYSSLILNISNTGGSSLVQLLDKTEKVLEEKKIEGDSKVTFRLLDKGSYKARIISDINGDGHWTTGDFFTGRQPEPSSYYPGEIEIPEGWEATQEWDVSEKNFKKHELRSKPKSQGR